MSYYQVEKVPEEFGIGCLKETVGGAEGQDVYPKHAYKEGGGRASWQKGPPEIGIGGNFVVGS